jgi:hypothetical protein
VTKWKGEAGKVRRKVLGAVDARMKKKIGESDLGRLYAGDYPLFARNWPGLVTGRGARDNRERNQAVLYAAALGVSLEDAQARIAQQRETVGDTFVPGKPALPSSAKPWVIPSCPARATFTPSP